MSELILALLITSSPFALSVLSLVIALSFKAGYDKKYEEVLREIKNLREEYMMGRLDAAATGIIIKAKNDIEGITTVKAFTDKPKRGKNP